MTGSVLGIFMAVLYATAMADVKDDFNFCDPDAACAGACITLYGDVLLKKNGVPPQGTCANDDTSNNAARVCHCKFDNVPLPDPLIPRVAFANVNYDAPSQSSVSAISASTFLNFCDPTQSNESCRFACSRSSPIAPVLGSCMKNNKTKKYFCSCK
jgi:hypothetical protein